MKLRSRRGQGMTEYIIIVALIAIAAIGVVSLSATTSASCSPLGERTGRQRERPDRHQAVQEAVARPKNMKDFGMNNNGDK